MTDTNGIKNSLIEMWIPVKELSRDATIEMAYKAKPAYIKHCRELKIPEKKIRREFFDPKIRNLHPWFARRPCSIARGITLAAVLPSKITKEDFMKSIGWDKKPLAFLEEGYPPLLFYTDPDRERINELVAKLLGKAVNEIIICDPMAGGGTIPLESLRLGFKTIAVEYNPVAYLILKGTIEYPTLYGQRLAAHVQEEAKRLIAHIQNKLGKFYPPGTEGYIIARGIKCPKCGGKIPLISDTQIASSVYLDLKIDVSTKSFNPTIVKYPTKLPYEGRKRGEIICPFCNNKIDKRDAYKSWTTNHVNILNELRDGKVDEDKILSTHILIIRQNRGAYNICNEEDFSHFLEACKELSNSFKELEKYIPKSEIPKDNEVFAPIRSYGINYWYELFNPRQLLALAILIKYVQEASEKALIKGELEAASCLYLAFGVSRMADYNSIITTWKQGTIRDALGQYAQGRKMSYSENYCEAIVPYRNLNWIFEPNSSNTKTEGGICPILNELCKRLEGLKEISVIHGDSRFLSSVLAGVKVNVINVDPPYFDQHIYSDISEYFWQILCVGLKPLIKAGFIFNKGGLPNWEPTSLAVPREAEVIVRKKQHTFFNINWYTKQMSKIFEECSKVLTDDGILLVWFTHNSIEAWKAIITALYIGGFYVTKIWPVTSELLTRLVSKGNGPVLNKTLIIVARKRKEEKIDENLLKDYALHLMEEMYNVLANLGATKTELHIFLKAAAMCAATKANLPKDKDPIQYCELKLIPLLVSFADKMSPILYRQFDKAHPNLESFFNNRH
jgi:adenine-specific DNA methylase